MTVQAAVEAELPGLRAEAESLMLDTGKALRPTGAAYDPTADGGNGATVTTYADLFGSDAEPIKCKVKPSRSLSPREAEAGARTVVTIPAELHLPAKPEYAGLKDGDIWEIVTVGPTTLHPVGRQYRISSEVDGTYPTACRYTVERVVS